MKKEFNIKEFMYDQLLNDGRKQVHISPSSLESVYHFLIKTLDEPAQEAGLRMSIFEQEFPTVSSFSFGYSRDADKAYLQENIVSNVESIDITHIEQSGKLYKINVVVDGKKTGMEEDELNGLISSIIGEETSIPSSFNPEEFEEINQKLLAQDIEVDYNDDMDVS